jgi:hypothetical protein
VRAVKKIKRIIEKNPQDQTAQIFSKLITSLAEEVDFSLKDLYLLDANEFQLAMEVLQEWRLDRGVYAWAKQRSSMLLCKHWHWASQKIKSAT